MQTQSAIEQKIATTQRAFVEKSAESRQAAESLRQEITKQNAESKLNHEVLITALHEQIQTAQRNKEALLANGNSVMDAIRNASDSSKEMLCTIAQSTQSITKQQDRLTFVSDQCGMLLENIDSFKKEVLAMLHAAKENSTSDAKQLLENAHTIIETISSLETETKKLQTNNAEFAVQQKQLAKNSQQENAAGQQSIESGIAGIQNSLLLLEERLSLLSIAPDAVSRASEKNGTVSAADKRKAGKAAEGRNESAKTQRFEKSVVTATNGDRIEFEPQKNGKTLSRTFRNGKLIFEIVHSEFGMPEKGSMFSETGSILKKFEYGSNGQVK